VELKEVLGWRRPIRFYLPYRPVERARAEKMLEAAPLPWREAELKCAMRALGSEEEKQVTGFQELRE
jgi:hypothetical protein